MLCKSVLKIVKQNQKNNLNIIEHKGKLYRYINNEIHNQQVNLNTIIFYFCPGQSLETSNLLIVIYI